MTFKVVAEKDNEKPQLSAKPKELKKTLVHYGCGPSIHVVFSNPAKDNSDIIVKTTVKDLKTGKETTYYIEPEGDKIKVLCTGVDPVHGSIRLSVKALHQRQSRH